MFQLMRSRAKFFYWFIAITFIGFTFVVWGAQCNDPGPQRQGPVTVGSVNGETITGEEWSNAYRNYLAQLRQQFQRESLDENQRAMAAETVWQSLVRVKLENQEIKRRGLEATDTEILEKLRNDPPPELLAQFAGEDGVPDMALYRSELANPDRDWTGVENYLRVILPRQKLADIIAEDASVAETEIREEYVRRTGRATAEYVGVLLSDIPSAGEPDDAVVQAWYESHPDDYAEPEKVVVHMVRVPKAPSEMDTLLVKEDAIQTRNEIVKGDMDFAQAAAIFSEDEGSRESGGDLGTFDRNRMVAPFTEAAFSLEVGQVSDLVQTQFGYHLIEVLDREMENGEVARVHARHILFKIAPGDSTINHLYDRAAKFREDALDVGFDEAAADMGLDVDTPRPCREGRDIPGYRNTVQGSQFAFATDTGAISPVYETPEYFYVLHNVEYLPAGPAALEDVRAQVVAAVNTDSKLQQAKAKLAPATAALEAGRGFADVAAEFGLKYAVTDTFTATGNVQDVGYNTDFNTVAMSTPVGQIVGDVETNRGVFALRVLWRQDFDEADYALQREALQAQLLGAKQSELVEAWYETQLAKAKINDRREVLYGN